jgi:outer membrane protein OmpA-like peptidoglycan-associated protein
MKYILRLPIAVLALMAIGLIGDSSAQTKLNPTEPLKFLDMNQIVRALAPGVYTAQQLENVGHVDLRVPFAFDSAELTKEAKSQLDQLAKALSSTDLASERFQVVGHTDAKGTKAYNLALSYRRAEAVVAYLVDKRDLAGDRLQYEGRGEEQPRNRLDTESADNRRVEILLVRRKILVKPEGTGKMDWGAKVRTKSKSKRSTGDKIKW